MSLRLIQQSQDKKSLLTHVHCRHIEEEEEHKIKIDLLLKKTIVTYLLLPRTKDDFTN